MGAPKTAVTIKSLGRNAKLLDKPISTISLLGGREKPKWSQTTDALTIELAKDYPSDIAVVYKITPKR
jgi:alpha-L-fucosidase